MDANEAIGFLEVPFDYPGSRESGNYLLEAVQAKAHWLLNRGERIALLEALRRWIAGRTLPRTTLAVEIAGTLMLAELTADLKVLRDDISSGRAFLPYYVQFIDKALSGMDIEKDRSR